MKRSLPPFRWPRFLVCFIAAPLLVTGMTYWLFIPLYALILGGPFYLIAGLPVAAWYLRRPYARASILLLLAMGVSLLQLPAYVLWAALSGNRDLLEALPVFLAFGTGFALLWSGVFLLLYILSARAEPAPKENSDVQS